MEWINLWILWPRIVMMKPYVPQRIFSKIEWALGRPRPTRSQLGKISSLGESIGLQKNEIIAATNLPIDNIRLIGRSRVTLFGVLLSIIIIVCISFGLALLMNNGQFFNPTPTFTYTPGTKYGSISPNDFTNSA